MSETNGIDSTGGHGVQGVAVEKLQSKLRISRALNIALLLLVVILSVVVFTGGNKTITPTSADQAVPVPTEAADPVESEQPGAADGQTPTQEPSEAADAHLRMDPNDPMAIGDINAPVIMSEWFDYRCPYCAVFATETLPTLISEYVETGKLRIEFNDVYFFGDDSRDAAIAARAAAAQGYFLPYTEALFEAAPTSGHPDLPRETLVEFAKTAGVPDMDKFVADLDSAQLAAAVDSSHDQAVGWGITSVPFFVIDGQAIPGAQPLDVFRQVLDEQLAQ